MGFMDKVTDVKDKTAFDDKALAELKMRKTRYQDEQNDTD